MQITKNDILWYLNTAPLFGKAIMETADLIKYTKKDIYCGYVEIYFCKLVKKYTNLEINFPFTIQKNTIGEPYNHTICISVDQCIAHGKYKITEKLRIGNIVTIDAGISAIAPSGRIMYFDSAITIICGNKQREVEENYFIKTPLYALKKMTKLNGNINTLQLSAIVQKGIENTSNGIVQTLSGHGIGYKLHTTPYISNVIDFRAAENLVPGTLICPEPMYVFNNNNFLAKTYLADDGWSVITNGLSTHWETVFYYNGNFLIDTTGILSYEEE
jgi:methionyl aminopeptidase